MSDDKDSKTFDPTQKKIDDAKKKGQVARSKELSNFVTLFFAALFFLYLTFADASGIISWYKGMFVFDTETFITDGEFGRKIVEAIYGAAYFVLAFLFICLISAILGNVALGGWLFSFQAAQPKLEKINPIKGLKKIFSMKTLVELIKSLLKMILLGCVGYLYMSVYENQIKSLSFYEMDALVGYLARTSAVFFLVVSFSLIVLVLVDAPFQLYDHKKNLKMSFQDLRDESKDTDGDPHMKAKVKEQQMSIANSRMMDAVPNADFIITNPTHYSVAVSYDESSLGVPVVVASGVSGVAFKIREIALENSIPIIESPELARSLYRFVPVGEVIPEELYKAVAMVINYINSIEAMTASQKQSAYAQVSKVKVPQNVYYEG